MSFKNFSLSSSSPLNNLERFLFTHRLSDYLSMAVCALSQVVHGEQIVVRGGDIVEGLRGRAALRVGVVFVLLLVLLL